MILPASQPVAHKLDGDEPVAGDRANELDSLKPARRMQIVLWSDYDESMPAVWSCPVGLRRIRVLFARCFGVAAFRVALAIRLGQVAVIFRRRVKKGDL